MPAKIDLTNQRFSYLTVVKEKERQSKKERLLWECQCDCGNVTYVSGTDLRSGHTKSCGCAKSQPINMLGFKTGKLTVISQAKSDNGAKWNCQCECGKIIQVFGSTLRGKKAPQSCGCERVRKLIEYNQTHNIIDISNQVFGHLIAIEPIEQRSNDGTVIWRCKCDCGQETFVTGVDLRSGNTKSCGCGRNRSWGQEKIESLLTQNNLTYTKEKTFQDLRFPDTHYLARYDFYVNNQYLIEFDGKQHFVQSTGYYDNPEKFAKTQEHDKIKNQYAKDHNITLIRIPYTHLNELCIEDLLPETSGFVIN